MPAKQKAIKFDPDEHKLNFRFDYQPNETVVLKKLKCKPLSRDDIRQIVLWKLNRVVNIPDDLLRTMGDWAARKSLDANAPEVRTVLQQLVGCTGIGYPMASAILKFMRPDVFPIIDVRAYRAITGQKLRSNQYTTEKYLKYIASLRAIQKKKGIKKFETVDEQLYCFDKKFNGKI